MKIHVRVTLEAKYDEPILYQRVLELADGAAAFKQAGAIMDAVDAAAPSAVDPERADRDAYVADLERKVADLERRIAAITAPVTIDEAAARG